VESSTFSVGYGSGSQPMGRYPLVVEVLISTPKLVFPPRPDSTMPVAQTS